MNRALPLIEEVMPSPTTKPDLPNGKTLTPRLGPSGSRKGGVGQGA
jgi:hypothetical protein